MTRHDCPGEDCGYCQRLIDQAETDRLYPPEVEPWDEP